MMNRSNKIFPFYSAGQAALPTILLICAIIVEIAIAGVLIAFILANSGFGERLSAQAFSAAKAGIEDAFIKLTVDKTYRALEEKGGYSLDFGKDRIVKIIVEQFDQSGAEPDGEEPKWIKVKIISIAKALGRQRKMEGILVIDNITGKVELESIESID